MPVDPFTEYNIVSSGQSSMKEDKPKKRSILLSVILLLLLSGFLVLSIYLLGTRTSFFNFASELLPGELGNISSPKPLVSVLPTSTPEVATTSATTSETSTTSSTIAIPVSTATPTSAPTSVAIENSYMFASPLSAATGNVEKIRVTVFILDGTGAGVSGKVVSLSGVDLLAVTSVQATTDSMGRAIFDLAAGTDGRYEIGAGVGGSSLSQKVTVTFD